MIIKRGRLSHRTILKRVSAARYNENILKNSNRIPRLSLYDISVLL